MDDIFAPARTEPPTPATPRPETSLVKLAARVDGSSATEPPTPGRRGPMACGVYVHGDRGALDIPLEGTRSNEAVAVYAGARPVLGALDIRGLVEEEQVGGGASEPPGCGSAMRSLQGAGSQFYDVRGLVEEEHGVAMPVPRRVREVRRAQA